VFKKKAGEKICVQLITFDSTKKKNKTHINHTPHNEHSKYINIIALSYTHQQERKKNENKRGKAQFILFQFYKWYSNNIIITVAERN
jgi:hypothetical protein